MIMMRVIMMISHIILILMSLILMIWKIKILIQRIIIIIIMVNVIMIMIMLMISLIMMIWHHKIQSYYLHLWNWFSISEVLILHFFNLFSKLWIYFFTQFCSTSSIFLLILHLEVKMYSKKLSLSHGSNPIIDGCWAMDPWLRSLLLGDGSNPPEIGFLTHGSRYFFNDLNHDSKVKMSS